MLPLNGLGGKNAAKSWTSHLARPLRWVLPDHHRISIRASSSDIPDCLFFGTSVHAVEERRQ
jgi:hypothetical protein